jgi:hypothetical protein
MMDEFKISEADILDMWDLKKSEDIRRENVIVSCCIQMLETSILQWRFFHQSLLNLKDSQAMVVGVRQLFKEALMSSYIADQEYCKTRTRYTHDQIFFSRCMIDSLAFYLYGKGELTGIDQNIAFYFIYKSLRLLPWYAEEKKGSILKSSEVTTVQGLIDKMQGIPEDFLPHKVRARLLDFATNFYSEEDNQPLGEWLIKCALDDAMVSEVKNRFNALLEEVRSDPFPEDFKQDTDLIEHSEKPDAQADTDQIEDLEKQEGATQLFHMADLDISIKDKEEPTDQAATSQDEEEVASTEEAPDRSEDALDRADEIKLRYYLKEQTTAHTFRIFDLQEKRDGEKVRKKQFLSYFLTPENPQYLKRKVWEKHLKSNEYWVAQCKEVAKEDIAEIDRKIERRQARQTERKLRVAASFAQNEPLLLKTQASRTKQGEKPSGKNGHKLKGNKMKDDIHRMPPPFQPVRTVLAKRPLPPIPDRLLPEIKVEFKHAILPMFEQLLPQIPELELYKQVLRKEMTTPISWSELMSKLSSWKWEIREIGDSFCLLQPPQWFARVIFSREGATQLHQAAFMIPYPPISINSPLTEDQIELLKLVFQAETGLTEPIVDALLIACL